MSEMFPLLGRVAQAHVFFLVFFSKRHSVGEEAKFF